MEVDPFGVDVIQPVIIRTDFQAETPRYLRDISGGGAYRELAEAMARAAEAPVGHQNTPASDLGVATAIRD